MDFSKKHEHSLFLADPNVVYRKYGGKWTCDGCRVKNDRHVLMFHCPDCNYDLCSSCFCLIDDGHPDHPHKFKLVSRDLTGSFNLDKCSECGAKVDAAHVCQTCKEPSFVLCDSCFNGFHGLLSNIQE